MIDYRKWLAFGTGVGIEVRNNQLDVSVLRVRPAGVAVAGAATVLDYSKRPASEWGSELTAFLRKAGAEHIAATVLVPRRDVIVRQLTMPGVKRRDLAAAISFQLDGLHPFDEDEVVHSFAPVSGTDVVIVGVTRREVLEKYVAQFAEAGLRVAAFTFSAAAIYSALRTLRTGPPPQGFIAVHPSPSGLELYGESPSYPVFSSSFDDTNLRAVELAVAELRLPAETAPLMLSQLLPPPSRFTEGYDPKGPDYPGHALAYSAALANACPWLGLNVNLLPEGMRKASSRVRYVPTAILAGTLALLLLGLFAERYIMDGRYLNLLEGEVKKLEVEARRSAQVDKGITESRGRTFALDEFRRRTKLDLDALNELTRVVEPPGWVSSLELTRDGMRLNGETQSAAELLKILDNSPYFKNSEFVSGIVRSATGEAFQVRSNREWPSPDALPAGREMKVQRTPSVATSSTLPAVSK